MHQPVAPDNRRCLLTIGPVDEREFAKFGGVEDFQASALQRREHGVAHDVLARNVVAFERLEHNARQMQLPRWHEQLGHKRGALRQFRDERQRDEPTQACLRIIGGGRDRDERLDQRLATGARLWLRAHIVCLSVTPAQPTRASTTAAAPWRRCDRTPPSAAPL